MSNKGEAVFALTVLFAINTMNFFDRQILGAVGEMVRKDWSLSDTALGTLGTAELPEAELELCKLCFALTTLIPVAIKDLVMGPKQKCFEF